MKIYIAGKINGDPDYKEKFQKATDKIKSIGSCSIISPATLPSGLSNADYMRICFSMIDSADLVIFLPDYQESDGAMLEMSYCVYIQKPYDMIYNLPFEEIEN